MNKKLVHSVFESEAARVPHNIAIEEEGYSISYEKLNDSSNELVSLLTSLGVGKDSIIGSILPSSINLIKALLATFKSGGVYLPLDILFSEKRLSQIFFQCKIEIVITNVELKEKVIALLNQLDIKLNYLIVLDQQIETYVFDQQRNNFTAVFFDPSVHKRNKQSISIDPADSNYIFYTSGSTGEAKGILGKHESLSHFINWEINEFSIDESVRVSQLTQITFDASLRDIFLPLSVGGTLCIPSSETKTNIVKLIKWIEASKVSLIHCVPSLFRIITKEVKAISQVDTVFRNVKHLLLAGEAVYSKDIKIWRELVGEHIELVNLYGTTETTLIKTFYRIKEISEDLTQVISIGKPIDNTVVAIINDNHICRTGEIGEIYIKTPFWSKGYINDSEITFNPFVQNPLVKDRKDIVYKTGDLGRYVSDRNIEVIGRVDNQIKVNGIRVEINEIERAVLKIEGINQTIIIASKTSDYLVELICYYTGEKLDINFILSQLKPELNENLTPSYFLWLVEFPLNINGKIDKKALPKPQEILEREFEYEKPVGSIEEKLEEIWKTILRINKIGRKVSFFQVGGSSLRVFQLISRIYREFNTSISIADVFSNPSIEKIAGVIEKSLETVYIEIPLIPIESDYLLSHAQKRLWVLNQLDKESVAYNMPGGFSFEGQLNREALSQTFRALIERHEVLRTTFIVKEGEPRQKVHAAEDYNFQLYYEDLREYKDKGARSKSISYEESTKRFDLEQGPLLRARLLQLEEEEYIFLFTMHHIISDAWSMEVLVREVLLLYTAYSQGLSNPLRPLRIQYKDYVAWQQEQLTGEKLIEAQQHWWDQFAEDVPKLEFPTDYKRPTVKTYNGNYLNISLSREDTFGLNQLSSIQGGTLFMTLLSIINVLLYKYTGQKDIVIGSPIVGRDHPDLEDQIGIYLNNLSLRAKFSGTDSFSTLLTQVKENTLEAYKHQHYPFDRLVGDLNLDRDMSRSPMFDVVVVLQNVDIDKGDSSKSDSGEEVKGIGIDTGFRASLVDLRIIFYESMGVLHMTIEYNTDLFKPERIERMLVHYQELVKSILKDQDQSLDDLTYLSSAEQTQLLTGFNLTKRDYASSHTLQELFEFQVSNNGDLIAIENGNLKLTYKTLNDISNQLAHYLRAQYKIGRESKVGLMVDRSERLIIGLLGILKSGGCYVPIDPSYPKERRDYLLKDSDIRLLLTESDKLFKLDGYEGSLFALDIELEGLSTLDTNPQVINEEDDLAYMIYTSGSTGLPKGVMIAHRGAVNMILSQIEVFGIKKEDRILQFASCSFDASISEIFMGLGIGACVVLIDEAMQIDQILFRAYMLAKGVTVVTLPPSYLRVLDKAAVSGLRVLITAGESADVGDALHLSEQLNYYNAYGPTECSVCVSIHKVSTDDKEFGSIPIGKPIANTELYILDDARSLVGIGIEGGLYVSGLGLAKGYHKLEGLTAQSFIAHPYKAGVRLYNTGDLCRWTEDGVLLYKGRRDNQLKIRGYRIEAGEIETILKQYEGVREAVVEGVEDGSGSKVLVAYVVSENPFEDVEVKNYLQRHLPGYMIPTYLLNLEKIPLTSQGKIDRQSLPKPSDMGIGSSVYIAPRTKTEQVLTAIWEEVLDRRPIGIEDNFFEIGGQSLKAIQIVSRIQKELNKIIALREIFNYPKIHELAEVIENDNAVRGHLLKLADTRPDYPNLFFIPPIIGSATVYKELAEKIKNNFNVYGFQYSGFGHGEQLDDSIHAIADKFITEIMNVQSSGMIYLFGYSMGAIVAFEIAKRLEEKGEEINLILVDRTVEEFNTYNTTQSDLNTLFELHVSEWKEIIGRDEIERVKKLFINNINNLKNYKVANKIKGNITTITAKDNHKDPMMKNWSKHTSGRVKHLSVRGTHFDILNQENLIIISNVLEELLNVKNETIEIG